MSIKVNDLNSQKLDRLCMSILLILTWLLLINIWPSAAQNGSSPPGFDSSITAFPESVTGSAPPAAASPEDAASPDAAAADVTGAPTPCNVVFDPPLPADGVWRLVQGCGQAQIVTIEGEEVISTGTSCTLNCWDLNVAQGRNGKNVLHMYTTGFYGKHAISFTFITEDNRPHTEFITTYGDHKIPYSTNTPSIKQISYTVH
jgi:hypothetical protein